MRIFFTYWQHIIHNIYIYICHGMPWETYSSSRWVARPWLQNDPRQILLGCRSALTSSAWHGSAENGGTRGSWENHEISWNIMEHGPLKWTSQRVTYEKGHERASSFYSVSSWKGGKFEVQFYSLQAPLAGVFCVMSTTFWLKIKL